jgi:hypothetical protein
MVSGIYVIQAFIGGLAGAFAGTLNAKIVAGLAGQRGGAK